jgi:uncharacterized protein
MARRGKRASLVGVSDPRLSFASNETDVMVALQWGITVNATGKSVTLPMQHWFRFAGGKVVKVVASEDSAATAAAFA